MSLTVDARHLGTSELAWQGCAELAACPLLSVPRSGRVIVLAPHPDDEVLAVGGVMRAAAAAGCSVSIIAVTDGEASHPRSPTFAPSRLAELRAAERAIALHRLGIGDAAVHRLRVPDGGVRDVAELVDLLAAIIAGAAWCLAPWERDGHPDHDAVGRAAAIASACAQVPLIQYPVWAWHWAQPDRASLPWARARRFELDGAALRAKGEAIAAYRSQLEPLSDAPGDEAILPPAVVARFQRTFETVFV